MVKYSPRHPKVKGSSPTATSDTSGMYYKCFTILIYDRNDSGQYNETTITIVIYEPR